MISPNHGFWSLALSITMLQDFLGAAFSQFLSHKVDFFISFIELCCNLCSSVCCVDTYGWSLLVSYCTWTFRRGQSYSDRPWNIETSNPRLIKSISLFFLSLSPERIFIKSNRLKINISIAAFRLKTKKRFHWIKLLLIEKAFNIDWKKAFEIEPNTHTW